MPERFAAQMCYAKLFQVPTANDSPKTAGIPDTPASQAAVRKCELASRIAGSGCAPWTPLHHWQKKKTKCVCLRNGSRYQTSELAPEMLHLVLCRKKHGVICRRTPHFVEQSSACLRENLRKKNWSQNVKKPKLPTSKFKKCACNSACARLSDGVTGCFQLNKRVVLKLLTAKNKYERKIKNDKL